jgi:hypothetical protein
MEEDEEGRERRKKWNNLDFAKIISKNTKLNYTELW